MKSYQIGDWVVFRTTKHSTTPGPRAKDITPSSHGDEYSYTVDKFWVVKDVQQDQLVVQTRTGKERTVPVDHHCLRRASWWEKIWYRDRFPDPQSQTRKQNAEPSQDHRVKSLG